VELKYNGKNSKGKTSISLPHGLICSSDTNSTNKYPSKNILDCQNANLNIAQVSDDNVDTVRNGSLTVQDTTHIRIFPVI